jgi:hypothetical protein
VAERRPPDEIVDGSSTRDPEVVRLEALVTRWRRRFESSLTEFEAQAARERSRAAELAAELDVLKEQLAHARRAEAAALDELVLLRDDNKVLSRAASAAARALGDLESTRGPSASET